VPADEEVQDNWASCGPSNCEATEEVDRRFLDECMADDDELTATKLQAILKETYPSLSVSVSTVKRARVELG